MASNSCDNLPLHLIGTPAFLPALLAHLHSAANLASLPLDNVIFQSILLCLVAGDKHLILRTPEEDISFAVKLALWTLSSIFGLSTHKLKIRSRGSSSLNSTTSSADPAVFLRSLFLPANSSSSNSNQTSQDEGSGENLPFNHLGHHRQQAHSRTGKHKAYQQTERSRSFPNNLSSVIHDYADTDSLEPLLMQSSVPAINIIHPSSSHAFPSTPIPKPHPKYAHEASHRIDANTEQLPHPSRRKKLTVQTKTPLQLPQALVISGLEYASNSTQRSFATVLAEKRVILEKKPEEGSGAGETKFFHGEISPTDGNDGIWNLPESFITIYICPLNARERPQIHKSLLDKFALSNNIFIPQNIRNDFRQLPFSPPSRPFHPHFFSHSNPGSPAPSHPMSLPQTPPTFAKPLQHRPSSHFNPPHVPNDILPPHFIKALRDARLRTYISHTLQLYLSDLFSATRHNSRLQATLLTARSMKDAEDLIRASRVVGTDLTGMELVRPTATVADEVSVSESDSQHQQLSQEYERLADEPSNTDDPTPPGQILDVSEVDIARIVPRVVSHRVRMRDGPDDEILSSLLFGATFRPAVPQGAETSGEKENHPKMETVKDVLVHILAEV